MYRSVIAKLKGDYPEMGVFRAANTYLGHARVIKSKKGEGYAIPASPVLNWSPPTSLPKGTGARILWLWSETKKTRLYVLRAGRTQSHERGYQRR